MNKIEDNLTFCTVFGNLDLSVVEDCSKCNNLLGKIEIREIKFT